MLKIRRNGSRKGFTLAELLIVVAIIAVLVAIAVPLFIGSLNKAAKARDDANIRAVRGAAVVSLLENSTVASYWYTDPDTKKSPAEEWEVTATLGNNGEIKTLKIAAKAKDGAANTFTSDGTITATDDGFTVMLKLTKTEVKDIPAGT